MIKSIEEEANQRVKDLLKGVSTYQAHPYHRSVKEPSVVWRQGAARLLDYGPAKSRGPAVLLIPSLINRYYILDLEEDNSFARHMSNQGFRVFILDWDSPSAVEHNFNCADYVTEHLCGAITHIKSRVKTPLILAGYCMGGLLALAAAQLKQKQLAGVALLATPWDFSSPDFFHVALDKTATERLETLLANTTLVPGEVVQTLFYLANPLIFGSKFRQFLKMSVGSEESHNFVALEDWVNDNVPMVRGVARDCFIEWTQHNTPASKQWKVGGQVVDPAKVKLPAFIATPSNDRIVPPSCALPLARLMPQSELHQPASGHVGMVVSHRAERELWRPFSNWLTQF